MTSYAPWSYNDYIDNIKQLSYLTCKLKNMFYMQTTEENIQRIFGVVIDDFSIKMNELYPIISRPSYIAMSQCEGVTPGMRNETLSVFAGISLYAGVPQRELTNQVIASTWLGLDKREIETIIHSAYSKGYNRFKHPWYQSLITPEEELKTREAIATVHSFL